MSVNKTSILEMARGAILERTELKSEQQTILDYLDSLVTNYRERRNLAEFADQIELCLGNQGIHVYKGIENLAKAAEKPIQTMPRCDDEYPYEKQFIYKGIHFYELAERCEYETI